MANMFLHVLKFFFHVPAKYAEFNGVNTVTVSSLDGETQTWEDKICAGAFVRVVSILS